MSRIRRAFRASLTSQSLYFIALLTAGVTGFTSANIALGSTVNWQRSYRQAASDSARSGQPMVIMVTADWCGYCRKMLAETFSNPSIASTMRNSFVPVLVDYDQNAELVRLLNIEAMPTVLIVSTEQKIVGRFSGYQSAGELAAHLALFERRHVVPAQKGNDHSHVDWGQRDPADEGSRAIRRPNSFTYRAYEGLQQSVREVPTPRSPAYPYDWSFSQMGR